MATLNNKLPRVDWWTDPTTDTLYLAFRDYYDNTYIIPILQDQPYYAARVATTITEDRRMRRRVLQNISTWAITELAKMELEQ